MRRDLTIRCVSTGTVQTESPEGARFALRESWLELDGMPARVQIMETADRGQRMRECTVEFDRVAVRSRAGRDAPPMAMRRTPLDWLLAIAEAMEEGESRTVALWVRSMEPAALLHATPVTTAGVARLAKEARDEEGAPAPPPPPHRLRLVAASS